MDYLNQITNNFHFIRPIWLLLIPLCVVFWVWLRHKNSPLQQWKKIVAPHLLSHLIVGIAKKSIFDPVNVIFLSLIMLSASIAGPTWEKKQTPFLKNNAPIVIVVELTPSMLAKDIKPSRAQRALQKVRDLIELKISSQIAIIVYSGSAHIAVPFTEDTKLLDLYAQSLSPAVMPIRGDDVVSALELARDLLSSQTIPGTILVISDGIDAFIDPALIAGREDQFLFYGFGTQAGDGEAKISGGIAGINLVGLQKAADTLSGEVILNSHDSQDIDSIQRAINNHLDGVNILGEEFQWHDGGYYLTWFIAVLMLMWSRKGWTIKWGV